MSSHPVPDAALEADIAILGKKGRGKTYTAKGCVERLLDMGRRVVVLDPLSTWWGLKAGRRGYAIPVIGGPHGDLPVRDVDGAPLGRFLATAEQSAVIDLGSMRKAEMIRFATPFLEELYTANRDPLWLVLEEADVFAPQNPAGDQARLYGEVDRIARRGRQFGFRLITLTQRPARLAKDVLTQLSTLIALGITSPQDRDAIRAWVEGNADRDQAKAVVDSLASLKVGEGWVWAPDLDILERVTFPPIRTVDTSATPKAGEARPDATVRKKVDVARLKAALTVVDQKTPSDDRQAPSSRTDEAQASAEAAAERRGYDRGLAAGLDFAREQVATRFRELEVLADALDAGALRIRRVKKGTEEFFAAPVPGGPASPARPAAKAAKAPPAAAGAVAPPSDGVLSGSAARMLDVVRRVRRSPATWADLATLSVISSAGGNFNAARKRLVEGGFVATVDGRIVAVGAALDAGDAPYPTRAAVIEGWQAKLGGSAARVLGAIAAGFEGSWADLAATLSLSSAGGNWNAARKALRAAGLVTEADGRVRLNPMIDDCTGGG